MTPDQHFRALEAMYSAAPVNVTTRPTMTVSEGRAEIGIEVGPHLFHTGGAVHGSIYFKLLDDAAFFAVSSLEREVFVLTSSFTTYITRPVSEGVMLAVGDVVHASRNQWIAESVVRDGFDRVVARGNGVFVRSGAALAHQEGYRDFVA